MKQIARQININQHKSISDNINLIISKGNKIKQIIPSRVNGFGVTTEIVVLYRKKILGLF